MQLQDDDVSTSDPTKRLDFSALPSQVAGGVQPRSVGISGIQQFQRGVGPRSESSSSSSCSNLNRRSRTDAAQLAEAMHERDNHSDGEGGSGSARKAAPAPGKEYDDSFYQKANIRDANKRRPTDAGYDPNTLYIPESIRRNFTPAELQYWDIKSRMMLTIVFFKVQRSHTHTQTLNRMHINCSLRALSLAVADLFVILSC